MGEIYNFAFGCTNVIKMLMLIPEIHLWAIHNFGRNYIVISPIRNLRLFLLKQIKIRSFKVGKVNSKNLTILKIIINHKYWLILAIFISFKCFLHFLLVFLRFGNIFGNKYEKPNSNIKRKEILVLPYYGLNARSFDYESNVLQINLRGWTKKKTFFSSTAISWLLLFGWS